MGLACRDKHTEHTKINRKTEENIIQQSEEPSNVQCSIFYSYLSRGIYGSMSRCEMMKNEYSHNSVRCGSATSEFQLGAKVVVDASTPSNI